MTISYGGSPGSSSGTSGDPSRKKQLYDCWMQMLSAIRALSLGQLPAVRGYYDVSKGFAHPVLDYDHNRVIRTVDYKNSHPYGPWERATAWRPNI